MLAKKAGLDRWAIRWLNALEVGDVFGTGQVLEKSVGIRKTLQAIKPHYDAAVAAGKAVGIGCGIKNTGIGNGVPEYGKCRLVVESPQRIALYNGYTEMGQGLFTVLVQFASEVSGVPPQLFAPITDTTFALQCGQTTGSRATLFSGNAAIQAATRLRSALVEAGPAGLAALVGQVFEGECKINDTTPLGAAVEKIKTHTAFSYATQLVVLDADGKLERVYAAHDVGRAINPVLCSAQVEGSVHMGLGYALSEDFACDERGWPVDPTMRGIGVMRARHVPPIEVILVEDHEPAGPFGAKGVGEIGLVPTAGAVAGALWAHDRVWRRQLPMLNSPAARSIVGKARAEAWAPLSKI
jgi:CO/xanthine dehydrogenase Mo-binding subunit